MSASTPAASRDNATISLVGLAHGLSHLHHLLLAPLFPLFATTFHLSYTELGGLVSVFFIISGVGQAVAGFVVDRFGPLRVLWASMLSFFLASVAAGTAQGHTGLLLAAALAGLGNASFHPIDFTVLNQRVSPARLGRAFAIHGISGNLGWALAPVLLLGIASATGQWRWAYAAIGTMTLLVLALLVWQRRLLATQSVKHHTTSAPTTADHPMAFLRLPTVWLCFSFFFWVTSALCAIQGFASPALSHLYGIPTATTAMVVTAYMVCGAMGMVAGGWLLGRVQRLEAIIAGSLVLAAALLVLAGSGWLSSWGALAATALAGIGTGLAGPSRDMLVKQVAPPGATGRVYGTVYSGLDIGFAVAAPMFGALLDHGHDRGVFWGAAALMLMGVASAKWASMYARAR